MMPRGNYALTQKYEMERRVQLCLTITIIDIIRIIMRHYLIFGRSHTQNTIITTLPEPESAA